MSIAPELDRGGDSDVAGLRDELVVTRGPRAGSRFRVDRDTTDIGRHPGAHIVLDDITVTRHHAVLTRTVRGYRIADLGSLGGTYVNRERVHTAWLTDGDEVQIGRFRFAVRLGRAATEADGPATAGARLDPAGLSATQIDVLRRVATGMSDPEIAADLGFSTAELGAYLDDIHRRLDVTSRASVAAYARGQGYAT